MGLSIFKYGGLLSIKNNPCETQATFENYAI